MLFSLAACLSTPAVAAQFTVTNTNSSGPGSLFQSITDANVDAAQDTISFNIPGLGVHVIDVSTNPLPQLQHPVLIEGYTQPGSHPNALAVGDNAVILIQIKGPGLSPSSFQGCFVVNGGATRIRGLSITGFSGAIRLLSPFGGNVIQGNFIGVDPSGQTAGPNDIGVGAYTAETTIGGSAPEERNVISGNRSEGLNMGLGVPALVTGNYIGTDATGTMAIPNGIGIYVAGGTASNHVSIGGADAAATNVISGNGTGIVMGSTDRQYSDPSHYATVAGNLIGTTADGRGPLGNTAGGIFIVDSDNNTIGGPDAASGNTIAFNGRQGIEVQGSASGYRTVGNRFLSNRIYANGWRGIVLSLFYGFTAPVPNDPKDPDTGPNNFQNYPILTKSSIANGTVTSNGTLNSTPNTQFTIQFFADSRNLTRPGQTYLGSTSVTTDGNGDAAFSVNFPISDDNVFINATATSASGDTSEFYYNPPRLVNVSTRLRVRTGDNVLIGGFIIGRESGLIVLRGLGPSLNINGTPIPGTLQDPILDLYDSKGKLLRKNNNWRDDPNAPATLGSLAPKNDLESAINAGFLEPGAYTVVLRGNNNTTGIGLVEVYLTASNYGSNDAELANISTRGLVETGDNVMIGGFIATDSNGPARYVIRAIGPSLASYGISNPLPDPTLELHDGNGAVIATNDDWKDGDEAAVRDTGLAPQNVSESVILTYLSTGAYTAIVRGKGNTTGVALVEVYNLH
jgi:hypothetical protein